MKQDSDQKSRSSLLPRLSVTRPVTVTMCLIGLLVIGIVAYNRISIQARAPGNDPDWFWVDVHQENATVQERYNDIALPLERHMKTLKDLRNIWAFAGDPWAGVRVEFRPGTDMDLTYNQVSDRLERAKLELPEEVRDKIKVWKWNPDQAEVLWSGLSVPDHIQNKEKYIRAHVMDPIERIDGVAKTEIYGIERKEVLIWVDQEKLRAHGIETFELVESLRRDNFALAGGYVQEGGKRYYVRSLAHYRSLDEIQNVPIRSKKSEKKIRLKDVAQIIHDAIPRERVWRVDGQKNLGFDVYKASGVNIVDLCERVVAKMEEIEATTDVEFRIFYSEGKMIADSMGNLRNTGLWGGFFAALILLFFLRAFRMTALITLSIPLCVMITITVLYFMGWTLNLLTMMGLMVGVGMVVDNAIVIVENIYRYRAKGENPHEASIKGASEVGLAITMATLTTVVVFLPMILMNDSFYMKYLLSKIGMPVVFALVASLFVALLFIPLAAKWFGGSVVKADPKSIRWSRNGYRRVLGWVVNHRRDTFLVVALLFATIWYPVEKVKQTDRMRFTSNRVSIRIHGPKSFDMKEMDEIATDVEKFLNARREKYHIKNVMTYFRRGYINIRLNLEDDPHQEWWYFVYKKVRGWMGVPVPQWMTRKEVINELKKTVPKYVGFRVAVESRSTSENDPYVRVYLYGTDYKVLEDMTDEVERRLRTIPTVVGTESDLEFGNDEVRVHLNRDQLRKHGIPVHVVGRTLYYQLMGAELPRYQTTDREVNVTLIMNQNDRQSLNQLRNFSFTTRSGEEVPLSSFATFEITKGPRYITKQNGKNRLRVKAYTTKDDVKGLYEEIDRAMEGFTLPRGYEWNKGERYSAYARESDAMTFGIIMAVTFVFLLMGILFESVILPFAVIFAIPFAFLGVYWGLFLTGTIMGFMSRVGVIVLIGVVVNNAIVLVDMINRLRAEGMGRREAIMEAGYNRYRPILMTTCTTIFGLLPMAIGSSTMMGIPYAPLGITMMGGLLVSTLLTLFVVPLFYTFLDDLRLMLRRLTVLTFKPSTRIVEDSARAAD
ncbi:MAG: efflux RND transporter permease subunit [bacterium]|nr:efflux RND transporter permease subunit [bacterium]